MKGRIRLYAEIGYDFGEPVWETEVQEFRIQDASGGSRGVERKIIGATLVDEQGRIVKDYEHDSCWAFRLEMVVTSKSVIDAGWIELTGVVAEFIDFDPADDLEECTTCEVAHPIHERYTSRIRRRDLTKTWAVVTVMESR